jgi:hypothetical protein
MPYRHRQLVGIKLTGWNQNAVRFIDPPSFEWAPTPNTAYYEARLAGPGDEEAASFRLSEPRFDMAEIWDDTPLGKIDLILLGFDSDERESCHSAYKHFLKVADFDGERQEPLDWASAIRRNMEYLLAPARDRIEEYERGLPRAVWSSMEDSYTGQRLSNTSCVGQYFPTWIRGLLLFAEHYPLDRLAPEARSQAAAFGDWLLGNCLPTEWTCSRMPYSLVMNGEFEEAEWGNTPCYSGRIGIAMIELHDATGKHEYLDYAHHLAEMLIKFQREDGSWPFRVDPRDGSVKPENEYTSNAIEPATLLAMLEERTPNDRYRESRLKAVEWTIDNPVKTRRWEQIYCDAPASPTWANLENWDTCQAIRYLIHYRDLSPNYVRFARMLNRFIEDQFVVWSPDDYPMPLARGAGGMGMVGPAVNLQTPTPMAMEQYLCPYPMESHTGNWLMSLIALHEATREEDFLVKAICAANAIVRGQQETGALATWGFDSRFGRPLCSFNWPSDNLCGTIGLMHLDGYVRSRNADKPWSIGLRGV